jgi:hypothetical protein
MEKIVNVVLMAAKNDPDGNPQRVYVGYNAKGIVEAVVEWYKQEDAGWLQAWKAENGTPSERRVTVSQYRAWQAAGSALAEEPK